MDHPGTPPVKRRRFFDEGSAPVAKKSRPATSRSSPAAEDGLGTQVQDVDIPDAPAEIEELGESAGVERPAVPIESVAETKPAGFDTALLISIIGDPLGAKELRTLEQISGGNMERGG